MAKRNSEEKRLTTSKKILWASMLLFTFTVFIAILFSYEGRDTSVFMYILPITGGNAGATIAFYLNKSKMENIFKFKIAFLKYKLRLIDENPDKACVIDSEMSSVEDALNCKIDSTMQEAISEDIDIKNY